MIAYTGFFLDNLYAHIKLITMAIVKVIEVIASSSKGFEDAVK